MAQIKSQIEEEAEGCFTSMIDIVFLLLIFFILQPFKNPDYRMLAYLPKSDEAGSSSSDDMKPTINIRIDGSRNKPIFIINDEVVKRKYLASRLIKASNGDDSSPVIIAASPTIYFDSVMRALDECAIANMNNVSFSAKY
ncbi:MAG: ExbD/TolR family protein [Planctomycetota bacterium]|jgi:biopolymer transport protein ExbD